MEIFKLLPDKNSESTKHVLVMFYGNLFIQGISIIAYPFLSRIYTPEQFGTFALFNSIIMILAVFSTMRFEAAIIFAKKTRDAIHLLYFSVGIGVISAISLALIFHFWGVNIFNILSLNLEGKHISLIAIALFFFLLIDIYIVWFNRNKAFKKITNIKLLRKTTYLAGVFLFAKTDIQYNGLILASIASNAIAYLLLPQLTIKRLHAYKQMGRIVKTIQQYMDFPKFQLPNSILHIISAQIPILLIAGMYKSIDMTGNFSMAYQLLSFPEIIIAASIGQVFTQKIAVNHNAGINIKTTIINTWKRLFIIGILPFLAFYIWGKGATIYFLGNDWALTAEIAVILAPLFLFMFINTPTSSTFTVYKLHHLLPLFGISTIALRIVSLYIGYLNQDLLLGLQLLVLAEIAKIIVKNIIILRHPFTQKP